MKKRFAQRLLATALLGVLVACNPSSDDASSDLAQLSTSSSPGVPDVDFTDMEARVEESLREAQRAVLVDPLAAETWGRFGMVAHAHELWNAALAAYAQAEGLDPNDVRWAYFRADVESVVGTDLEAAAAAFRRALALRPDYAPAHMRLGRVLVAAGKPEEAAIELQRALELEPGLQPARVTLAQIHLGEGRLDIAQRMLREILEAEPRHAQALSALGQVLMRQGQREEARGVAERARSAAIYNLFSDPLMSTVVAKGVSSVLVWERAKAFFDNGNYQQAALGLEQVLAVQLNNVEVHQQLGVALGNLGKLDRSLEHLQKAVALDPDRIEALVQLVMVQIETGRAAEAIPSIERILVLEPSDPDAPWLLARALVSSGDLDGGLRTFDELEKSGGEVPMWVRNDWGSALARSGRTNEALEQFRTVVSSDPDNAQAHFYIGLVLEGQGRADEAVAEYCRSMRSQPNAPAGTRLDALGRRCG